MHRRHFLGTAATAAAAVASARAAENHVGLAVIGCRGMGASHLRELGRRQDVRILAVCDIDERVLDTAGASVKKATGWAPRLVGDFRRVLDDKSIDAVVIATPHHWHAPIALVAMEAGKDVYVEKPASHVFREGRLMVETARRHRRVFQHGTQMRSSPVLDEAAKVLRSGILGDILMTKAWNVQDRGVQQPVPDSEPPQRVNYDMWLGPARVRPFNVNRFHSTWRLFRDYGNGDLGDDGAHDLDLARWGLGVTTHPIRITASGSNVRTPGYREYPDNTNVVFEYAGGKTLLYEERVFTPYGLHGVDSGNAFYGTRGYMIFSRRGYFQVFLGPKEEAGPTSGKPGRVGAPLGAHHDNFLACVRSRQETRANAEVAHLSAALIHLGEIAYRTRTVLEFDPQKERITNNAAANGLLTKEYRKPWNVAGLGS
jgi:predicted dehydrogenase